MSGEFSIFLSDKIVPVLLNTRKASCIAGFKSKDGLYCVATTRSTELMITGLGIVGIFHVIEDEDLRNRDITQYLDQYRVVYENPVIIFAKEADISEGYSDKLDVKVYNRSTKTLTDINVNYISQVPGMLLRAIGSMPMIFKASTNKDTLKENISSTLQEIKVTFANKKCAFRMEKGNFFLHSKVDSSIICENLYKFLQDDELQEFVKMNRKDIKKQIPIEFRICSNATASDFNDAGNYSLILHCQRKKFRSINLKLPLDVIILCQLSSSAHDIYNMFVEGIQQQLEKMGDWMLKCAKDLQFITPVPYHFYPYLWSVPVTIIYPFNKTDEELEPLRKQLHDLLLLPSDRPFLKKINKCEFSDSAYRYLINPHEGLPPSGIKGGKTSIVHGKYSYFHYMQDQVNDDGWGCAYRSLQTIISWFKFQGYTDKTIPTHTEIQKALVDMNDKPKTFIGSRNWIGSQEVAYCLEHLLNVTSRILCVNQGSEMCNFARDFFHHFQDQGTPVMIGGGQLAHTILGVDFNENTGDLKFLVLDPHYTGAEDLNKIQNKGFCGWKGPDFWNPNVFYNVCMPQCPGLI